MNAHVPDNDKIRQLPHVAAEHMGKSLMDLVLQEVRSQQDVWQKLSEAKQREAIERINRGVKYAVAGAVNTIATHGHIALMATVEGIALKDKIKLTVIVDKGNVTESLHNLYESGAESRCQILLTSAEPYVGGMDEVYAEPDQPGFSFGMPKADEDMPWGVSCPINRGQTTNIVPAPNKILAMQYAEQIRSKLLESDSDFRHDLAKSVYACPWRESAGAHERSMQAGNWETLVNWASLLDNCDDSQFDEQPLLAIAYVHADADVVAEEEVEVESEDLTDPLYSDAVAFVRETGKANASAIQRKLELGYNRASRIIDAMEAAGVVSPMSPSGARDVLPELTPPADETPSVDTPADKPSAAQDPDRTGQTINIIVTLKKGRFVAHEVDKPKPDLVSEINAEDAATAFFKSLGGVGSDLKETTSETDAALGTKRTFNGMILPF